MVGRENDLLEGKVFIWGERWNRTNYAVHGNISNIRLQHHPRPAGNIGDSTYLSLRHI